MYKILKLSNSKIPPPLELWGKIKGTLINFKKQEDFLIAVFSMEVCKYNREGNKEVADESIKV